MTIRKRRNPSAFFKLPPPYNPMEGEHADLRAYGENPYCALMQVAAPDSYADYVICRGFDTRTKSFVDYVEGEADNPGIAVAKPYGKRLRCYYQVGEIFPAFLPLTQIGQNPGVMESGGDDCDGMPLNTTDDVVTIDDEDKADDADCHLKDYNGDFVDWMLIDNGPTFLWAKLKQYLYPCGNALADILVADSSGEWCDACGYAIISVSDPHGIVAGNTLASNGYLLNGVHVLVMRVSDPQESGESLSVCEWAVVAIGSGECCGAGPDPESPASPSNLSSFSPSSPSPSSPISQSKSPAIVPASWTKDGYTALFTMESPGVEFTDVIDVVVSRKYQKINIDPRFIEVCEAGTIVCTGAQPNQPLHVGAEVIDNAVHVRFPGQSEDTVRLIISLRGTRKGFADTRFPNRTREQFEANEQFLKSAYPGA